MDIVNHKMCTATIAAPVDMKSGTPLPVFYHSDDEGIWAISFWKPTPAEVATINDGGGVTLHVRAVGGQHPVVGVGVYTADVAAAAPARPAPVYRCAHCCAISGNPHEPGCRELTNPTPDLSLPPKDQA